MKYLAAGIIGFVLYSTNPTEADFHILIKDTVQARTVEDNAIAKMLISGVVSDMAKAGTYRKDYVFFSKFTVDTSFISTFKQNLPPKIEFIGVLGQFVPLTEF